MLINLFNKDCAQALKQIESNSIDFCCTDLPYGVLIHTKKITADYQNDNRNFCNWDFQIDYDKVLPELKRVMKDNAAIALFAKSPFTYRLYEQMIKHGFKHRYNWIWKKSCAPNFASLKHVPKNDFEQVMIFSKTNKGLHYFPGAHLVGEEKCKCKFYNYKTRTPLSSEEVFDKYLIPFLLDNSQITDNIRIISKMGNKCGNDTVPSKGIKIIEALNPDIQFIAGRCGVREITDTFSLSNRGYKLDTIFKEKYRDQFEIDFENKVLYRTTKSYSGYPSSIIDIKYSVGNKNIKEKHPTTKPVEVLEYLLDRYTEEGDNVLDMTMGSGSMGVACKNKNRNFIRN